MALANTARGEDAQAIALLYGASYEQELERARTRSITFARYSINV